MPDINSYARGGFFVILEIEFMHLHLHAHESCSLPAELQSWNSSEEDLLE